ncbi:polyprenyl synthetase family protein [Bradyrhizobium sp.]|jgi:geranylgeranyl diphosphate synthase type II|uniref:polyprenyl synthetase family protein n=1 Tax=Bradyrhizobium sp. TaxID=376 RepID=UPI0025BFFBC4|nr:polyprenyl synthetase family protein [Bradyrhizobium sp.]
MTSLVADTLEEYGALTREALVSYLPNGYPTRYLYDLLADYPQRAGKMMRPSICIATARAFGANPTDAVRSAVAIELLHNAMLVHDDVQDGSALRRGGPTLHMLHGVPLAINAGDALFLLSLRPLLDNMGLFGGVLGLRILREMETMAWHSLEGQAIELGWIQENVLELGDADYLNMVLKKTCWLATIHPARIGALIGSRGAVDLEPFIRFGFFLGAAFQMQDDLLNLAPDLRYGKEMNGDLLEGKRSLLLIHAYRHCSPVERARLTRLFLRPRDKRKRQDVDWALSLMAAYGSAEYVRQFAHALAGAALHEFASIFGDLPPSRDKAFIHGLATWIFLR